MSGVTGDPLDRLASLEAKANFAETGGTLVSYSDLKLLVEVARAARDLESWQPQTKIGMASLHPQHLSALNDLRAALARLDGPR